MQNDLDTIEHSNEELLWNRRFAKTDKDFFAGIHEILEMNIPPVDYIYHFPIFNGHVNIARYLALYEAFKMVQGLAGHYADIGTWKGASFLYIAKLIRLFESQVSSQVHAFDWFCGMQPNAKGDQENYVGDYATLKKLVDIQNLNDLAIIHKIDLINELPLFAKDPVYGSTYFKYVYLDCGYEAVLEKTIPFFWDRLLTGGIMVFDHFATDVRPETEIARALLPKSAVIKHFSFARQPTGYVIKS